MTVRRTVLFGAPLLAYVASMLHPSHVLVHGSAWTYVGVHLAFAPIICLLAWMFVLLVDAVGGVFATATRLLAVPFAVAYTLYTAYSGISIGTLVWQGNQLPRGEQTGAAALIEQFTHNGVATGVRFVAIGLWLAVALATVGALRREAPAPSLVLFGLGALVFGYRHERPWGAAGMAMLLAGIVWLELKPRRSTQSQVRTAIRFGR